MSTLKVGSVPYYNARPLTHRLKDQVEMSYYAPANLVHAILEGECDLGLVPSFAAIKNDLHTYPEAGLIGCDGRVSSVGFFLKKDGPKIEDIDSLYLDTESNTSARLSQILLQELFGRNLKSIKFVSEENAFEADAQLLIGDKALFFRESNYDYVDLGELWKQLTGHGFVFACWASREPLSMDTIKMLIESKEWGMENISSLLDDIPEARKSLVEEYLRKDIMFDYTDALRAGFEEYKKYLLDRGFFKSAA